MIPFDAPAFADALADASAAAILPLFRSALTVENKSAPGGFDPVTAADRAAEEVMRELIRRTHPAHGIVGEEGGAERDDAEWVWVLDPIDGTKSFMSGMPLWGTLIALTRRGEPVFGVMNQPFTRERFSGDGHAARCRGPASEAEMRVRPCARLGDAVLFTTSPLLMTADERAVFGQVEREVRLSRYGGDCYIYCMLAAGHLDLVIESGLKPYDVAALIPIVEGAGGVITTWDGEPAQHGGRIVAAGDRRVHQAAMTLLRGA